MEKIPDMESSNEKESPNTPTLDAILAKLPAKSLDTRIQINLNIVEEARERLFSKMDAGTLTRMDIENELNDLPAMGGMESAKESLVNSIRMNLTNYDNDIEDLPVE